MTWLPRDMVWVSNRDSLGFTWERAGGRLLRMTIFHKTRVAAEPVWGLLRRKHNIFQKLPSTDVHRTNWKEFGHASGPTYFGPGLYTAIDPLISRDFGGDGAKWTLIQVTLPKGSRVVSLREDGIKPGPKIDSILKYLGCNTIVFQNAFYGTLAGRAPLNHWLVAKSQNSDLCHSAIQKIFAEALDLDAFEYAYPPTSVLFARKASYQGQIMKDRHS
jgi:hypothetical protein